VTQFKHHEILIFPRRFFKDYYGFVNWDDIEPLISELESSYKWCPRNEAEVSPNWVQPIPCALIKDNAGNYCVFRRIKETRKDLKGRISLVIGGHIERPKVSLTLPKLLSLTLSREIEEEIEIQQAPESHSLGLIVDNSTIQASRHIGFLYGILLNQPVVTTAPEEFSKNSKISGQFFSESELMRFHAQFDPWSKLIFEDLIQSSGTKSPQRQAELSLDI
jgi:predicted NUDIX family phosphoesterase